MPTRTDGPAGTTTKGIGMSADPARIAIARDVLAHLGITLADLNAAERAASDQPAGGRAVGGTPTAAGPASLGVSARFAIPTVSSYLPRVRAAAGPGANHTYGSYWTMMDRLWGLSRGRRPRPVGGRPRRGQLPDPAAGEGRHPALAAGQPRPAAALGRHARRLHPLVAPHHPHLGSSATSATATSAPTPGTPTASDPRPRPASRPTSTPWPRHWRP